MNNLKNVKKRKILDLMKSSKTKKTKTKFEVFPFRKPRVHLNVTYEYMKIPNPSGGDGNVQIFTDEDDVPKRDDSH